MSDLEAFFATFDIELVQRMNGWKIHHEGELVYFTLPARDEEEYTALIICDGYRQVAPGVAFIDEAGSKLVSAAWPAGDAYFADYVKPPPASFICAPITREGLEHHTEWKQNPSVSPWNPTLHDLSDVLNFLSRLLRSPHYSGRLKT